MTRLAVATVALALLLTGAPRPALLVISAAVPPVRASGTDGARTPVSHRQPEPASAMSVGSKEQGSGASPAHLSGRASWVRSSLGARYLAARLPRGTWLRICGPLDCVTRQVNDYGPSARIRPRRIVDMSRRDFATVCGSPSMGTCPVEAWIIPDLYPPATDSQP